MRGMLIAAGLLGLTGVGLGAFGAHGLEGLLESLDRDAESIPHRLENFATGVRYQMHAALAVAAVAALAGRGLGGRSAAVAATLFSFGAVVFSGLLYVLALVEGWRWLGAVVPIGGVAMIAGWAAIVVAAVRSRGPADDERYRLAAEVVRLEEVLTHQQQTVHDLNEAVTATRDAADESARRTQSIELAVKRLVDVQQAADDLPDERPPHY